MGFTTGLQTQLHFRRKLKLLGAAQSLVCNTKFWRYCLSKTRSGIKTATVQPEFLKKHSPSAVYVPHVNSNVMSRWERNRNSLLDSDSHVLVKIVHDLEEMLTKRSQVRLRENSDSCFSGTKKKNKISLHFPQSSGVCLALGIRICYLWQTLGIFNKGKIVPAEKLKLELAEIYFIQNVQSLFLV